MTRFRVYTSRVFRVSPREPCVHRIRLTDLTDDAIVVVMDEHPFDTVEYFATEETNRPRELAYGILREPPAPFFSHQTIVLRIARILSDYVEERRLGQVAIAPLDVVLDADRALVVQPDVLFVSNARQSSIRNQVWGAPDLVVEVLSAGTEAHDRGEKLNWYRQYGVREYWLVDAAAEQIEVVDLAIPDGRPRIARGLEIVSSTVLAGLSFTPFAVFV